MISNASREKFHLALKGDKDEMGQSTQADSVAEKLNIDDKLTIKICDFFVSNCLFFISYKFCLRFDYIWKWQTTESTFKKSKNKIFHNMLCILTFISHIYLVLYLVAEGSKVIHKNIVIRMQVWSLILTAIAYLEKHIN